MNQGQSQEPEPSFKTNDFDQCFDTDLDENARQLQARMKLLTAQNEKLVRLLESEEAHNAQLASESDLLREQLNHITEKFQDLEESSRFNAEVVQETSKERQLHLEEIRMLRVEIDRLKSQINEDNVKKTVEIESLEEHLRAMKAKQYQQLGKIQRLEETRKLSEDQVTELEEKLEKDHARFSSLELQLRLESQSRSHQEEVSKKLQSDNDSLTQENKELSSTLHKISQDKIKSEMDLSESSNQLRTMAEKVFQLLERLKLTELARSKTIEAIQLKEQELIELQKKHSHLVKQCCSEVTAREQLEAEKKDLEETVRMLKRQNLQIGQKCKEETKAKLRIEDDYKILEDKNNEISSKLSFLLNRIQIGEAEQSVRKERISQLEKEQERLIERNETLHEKLHLAEESKREFSVDLIKKTEELQLAQTKFDALSLMIQEKDDLKEESDIREKQRKQNDAKDIVLAEGRLRFFVECNKQLGMVTIRGKNSKDRQWLENNKCNLFLRKIQRSNNMEEALLHKLAELYGIIATQEDDDSRNCESIKKHETDIHSIRMKLDAAIKKLGHEEEFKTILLLKYVNVINISGPWDDTTFDGVIINLAGVRASLPFLKIPWPST